jgi:hypothetical protein
LSPERFYGGTDAAVAVISEISETMAYNVPAVYDVFAGRIGKPQVCSPAKMWVE